MLKAANDKPVHAPGEASEIIRHACLLIVGATAVIRHARAHPEKNPWIIKLLARMPAKKAAVALANKTSTDSLGAARQRRNVSPAEAAGGGMRGLQCRCIDWSGVGLAAIPRPNCEGDDGVMRIGRAVGQESPL
jgi:hypothetical protein